MELRFYIDPSTGQTHVFRHGVTELEVEQVLAAPVEDGGGNEGTRVAIGRSEAGRFLKVIYVPDPERREPVRDYCLPATAEGPPSAEA